MYLVRLGQGQKWLGSVAFLLVLWSIRWMPINSISEKQNYRSFVGIIRITHGIYTSHYLISPNPNGLVCWKHSRGWIEKPTMPWGPPGLPGPIKWFKHLNGHQVVHAFPGCIWPVLIATLRSRPARFSGCDHAVPISLRHQKILAWSRWTTHSGFFHWNAHALLKDWGLGTLKLPRLGVRLLFVCGVLILEGKGLPPWERISSLTTFQRVGITHTYIYIYIYNIYIYIIYNIYICIYILWM